MVLMAWSPNEIALENRHECALSQVGACPDMTLDVTRMQNPKMSSTRSDRQVCRAGARLLSSLDEANYLDLLLPPKLSWLECGAGDPGDMGTNPIHCNNI